MPPFEHSTAYEVVCDSADREAWLAARLTGIGASESAAVLGESRWNSPLKLYAEKVGIIEHDPEQQAEAQYWGSRLERLVAEEFTRRTGVEHFWHGKLLRSTKYEWALATLDATLGNGDSLECKTASAYKASEWTDGAPKEYVIQAHQQMLVTDTDRCRVACLIGGQQFVWCMVDRDEVLMRKLIARATEFWQRVHDRNPPPPDDSEHSREALEAMFPATDAGTAMLEARFLELDEQRQILKESVKSMQQRLTAIDNEIRAAIGNNQYGVLPNGVAYAWPEVNRAGFTVQPTTYRALKRIVPKKRK